MNAPLRPRNLKAALEMFIQDMSALRSHPAIQNSLADQFNLDEMENLSAFVERFTNNVAGVYALAAYEAGLSMKEARQTILEAVHDDLGAEINTVVTKLKDEAPPDRMHKDEARAYRHAAGY